MKTPLLVLWSTFFLLSSAFPQGSLTPPAAPTPTMKTLDQVEPRRPITGGASTVTISTAGSYYLTGNIAVSSGNGVTITSGDVTLDLNGFAISRASGSGGNGIEISETSHRVSIRNGSITGFGYGIRNLRNSSGQPSRSCAYRDLSLSGCTTGGISAGNVATIESCRAHDNSGPDPSFSAADGSSVINCTVMSSSAALEVGAYSVVSNCSANSNIGDVIFQIGPGCAVTHCTASGNTVITAAIQLSTGCTLTNFTAYLNFNVNSGAAAGIKATGGACTLINCNASYNNFVSSNVFKGILVAENNTLINCTASNNQSIGIETGNNCTLTGCTASGNLPSGDAGIRTGNGSTLSHCTANANSSAAGSSYGIQAGTDSLVTDCTASSNVSTNGSPTNTTGVGISLGDGSSLRSSIANGNKGDGIQLGARCQIIGCNSEGNGSGTTGSGITAGVRTTVKNCTALDNKNNGIAVGAESIVLENHASHNGLGVSAAGIAASGGDSRIEGNRARNNVGTGILAGATDLIIHNFSTGSGTPYNPASGVNFGPLDVPSTSTHPTANF